MVTIRMSTAKPPTRTRAPEVYVMKMTPELAAHLKDKAFGFVRLPRAFEVGSRVLLREFNGGPTGRADVCTIISNTNHGLAYVRRGWCWLRDAPEDSQALAQSLALELSGEVFPVRLEVEAGTV